MVISKKRRIDTSMEYDATSIDILVDDIRQALIERADGEEDPEATRGMNIYYTTWISSTRIYAH